MDNFIRTKLLGTGVAVITPFDSQRAVDIPALKRVIEHLIAGGVEYLVIQGTTGESATLTQEEKAQVIDIFVETTNKRVPLVLGVGGNNSAEVAKAMAHYSKNPDIDAILSVSPYYNKPSQEGIYQHYKYISEFSAKPILLYNVPGRTGANMLADTTLRIAADCANVIGVKEACGSLEQIMHLIQHRREGFLVISGDDALTLPILAAGGDGVISVAAHIHPSTFSEMVRLALDGQIPEARALHYDLLTEMNLCFKEGSPAGVKAALKLLGICEPFVRLPLVEASEDLAKLFQNQFSKTSIF